MEKDVIFRRTLRSLGTSMGTSLPIELVRFLEGQHGDVLAMCARSGKQGKGICIWIDKKVDGDK
jgi:hypothetical protein